MTSNVFSEQVRLKIDACAALGLSYWSDHPATGCVWAVDDRQQAHTVRLYRRTNQVALQRVTHRHSAAGSIRYRSYDVGDRLDVIRVQPGTQEEDHRTIGGQ